MVLAGLPVAADQEERQRALAIEREAVTAALEHLLVPALVPAVPLSKVDREIEHAAMSSLQPESELPQRERNRAVVERVEVVEPEPEPEPEPAAPELTGWRLSLARRRAAAAAVPA